MRSEQGKRFTDVIYATKEEIADYYNTSDISETLRKVRDYRSYYDYQTPLRDDDGNFYSICLTSPLLSRAYGLEKRLMRAELKYLTLSLSERFDIANDNKFKALMVFAKSNGLSPSDSSIWKIVNGSLSNLPVELSMAEAYSTAYDHFHQIDSISVDLICSINRTIIMDDEDSPVKFRKNSIEDYTNPLSQPPIEKIETMLESLCETLRDQEIPLVLRTIIIIYFFLAVKPFEYSNEETASILARALSAHEGYDFTGFALDFESLALIKNRKVFDRMRATQDNSDLTYACIVLLSGLEESMKKIEETLSSSSERTKDMDDSVPSEPDPVSRALPFFPPEGTDDVEAIAMNLTKLYPDLKRKQAHFYAGHCTIGFHYTINDFRVAEKTVYETARTSMDDLARRGFYKKDKINNKFIYSPIPRREDH